ncbi:MAG: hypothetical protein WC764_00315 [Candidatus Paceibacterota bacterium]|jgi:hypothetical protein
MNTQTASIGMVIALLIGGVVGYVSANQMLDTNAQNKKLAEAVSMMKKQTASIREMSKMMKDDGLMMQEAGAKYKDEKLTSMGKDTEVLSAKYVKENTEASGASASMGEMMR